MKHSKIKKEVRTNVDKKDDSEYDEIFTIRFQNSSFVKITFKYVPYIVQNKNFIRFESYWLEELPKNQNFLIHELNEYISTKESLSVLIHPSINNLRSSARKVISHLINSTKKPQLFYSNTTFSRYTLNDISHALYEFDNSMSLPLFNNNSDRNSSSYITLIPYSKFNAVIDINAVLTYPNNNFINLFTTDTHTKLYVLVAPTGFGKSTLINEMRYLCVKPMPKVTTRPIRNLAELQDTTIEFVSEDMFTKLSKDEVIIGSHLYNSHLYGLKKAKILNIPNSYINYVVDSCDVDSAFRLKQEFPDIIRLVTLFPSLTYAGFGLEERLKDLSKPSSGFDSFQEELDYLHKNKIALTDTKARLEHVVSESRKFEKYLPHFDIVLKGYDMQANVNQLLLEMAK